MSIADLPLPAWFTDDWHDAIIRQIEDYEEDHDDLPDAGDVIDWIMFDKRYPLANEDTEEDRAVVALLDPWATTIIAEWERIPDEDRVGPGDGTSGYESGYAGYLNRFTA